jgi:hypothetical protein
MQPREVEVWAVQVLAQVSAKAAYESSLVELKADWIEPQQAARRIAGHANSARGNAILWLIGVDEKRGVTGAPPKDLATWWTQVRAEFDHVAPELIDVSVDWQGLAVHALAFLTDLAPYVTRSPQFGKPGGGPVRYEVAWRQGTATESATRTQLLLLLSPVPKLPQFEVLEAQVAIERSNMGGVDRVDWNLSMLIYVMPRSDQRVAIAAHRVAARHELADGTGRIDYSGEVVMFPMGWRDGGYTPFVREPSVHPTIRGTNFDLTIDGPGLIKIIAKTAAGDLGPLSADRVAILRIAPAGSDLAVALSAPVHHNPRDDWKERWSYP